MSIKLNKYGKDYEITFEVTTYAVDNGLAIVMYCDEGQGKEPFATLTVYLEDFKTYGNKAFVDTNNLGDEILDWLAENNLGEQTSRLGFSGFCIYPEFDFNLDEINKHLT